MKKLIKDGALTLVVFILIFGGLDTYFTRFSSTPQGVVQNFWDAYVSYDYNAVVDCLEPKARPMIEGSIGLAGSVFEWITGISVDMQDFVDLMPLLGYLEIDFVEMPEIYDVAVVSYSGGTESAFTAFLCDVMPSAFNVLATHAVVQFHVRGEVHAYLIEVIHYGQDGWRIPLDAQLIAVQAGIEGGEQSVL